MWTLANEGINMRKIAYIIPAVLMSGCSLFSQGSNQGVFSQNYESGCKPTACQSASGYAVSQEASYNPYSQPQYAPQQAQQYVPQPYSQQQYLDDRNITNQIVQDVPALRGSIPYNSQTLENSVAYAAPVAYAAAPAYYPAAQRRNPGYLYGTLGGVLHDTKVDSLGLEGRLGYHTGRFIGAEVEGSVGLLNDNDIITTAASPVFLNRGYDYNAAAFAIARLPVSKRLSVHARGGYDFRSVDLEAIDGAGVVTNADANLDGFAYGLGAEYALAPNNGLRLDYTRYENDDINTADSISASYFVRF